MGKGVSGGGLFEQQLCFSVKLVRPMGHGHGFRPARNCVASQLSDRQVVLTCLIAITAAPYSRLTEINPFLRQNTFMQISVQDGRRRSVLPQGTLRIASSLTLNNFPDGFS